MKKKILIFGIFSTMLTFGGIAQADTIVQKNTNFITTPTNFNGFESIGPDFFPSGTVYSEGGINVAYVGAANIWTTYTPSIGGGGNYGWYENGGGFGFTKITMANNSDFQNIQFLVGNGYGPNVVINYQLLENGTVVSSGTSVATNRPMAYLGFSGAGFDEIQVQALAPGNNTAFDANNFDALAIDSIAVSTISAIPEPENYAMLLAGLGLMGFMVRRRKTS